MLQNHLLLLTIVAYFFEGISFWLYVSLLYKNFQLSGMYQNGWICLLWKTWKECFSSAKMPGQEWSCKNKLKTNIVIINMPFSLQKWHTKMWITFSRLGSQKTRCKITLTLEIHQIYTIHRNLETCNDQFLAFIERARVLSEATDIKLSLPKSL